MSFFKINGIKLNIKYYIIFIALKTEMLHMTTTIKKCRKQ